MACLNQTFSKKYNIPIAHLDFSYINTCKDAKEMEKIYKILKSGEEGYFPALTKCAEEKLKELKPNSKCLRIEEILKTKSAFDSSEWKEISDPFIEWSDEIKVKDKFLSTISGTGDDNSVDIPPVRQQTKEITLNDKGKKESKEEGNKLVQKAISNRIKSTDYREWDKYDAETEVLKMDLDEERIQEEIERKNLRNLKKSKELRVNSEIELKESNEVLETLTNVEKEALASRHKEKGNDYFRAREFENSVKEYTQSIKILPSAVNYNNRALANLKLLRYKDCLEDCDKCLEFEPKNIKALLRKAETFLGLNKRQEAYKVYMEVITIEPSNAAARRGLNEIKKHLPDLPPPTATRIKIEEDQTVTEGVDKKSNGKNEKKIRKTESGEVQKQVKSKYDLSQLIIPNKIVRSKLSSAIEKAENLRKQQKMKPKKGKAEDEISTKSEIKLFPEQNKIVNKQLIEEI